MKQKLEQQSQYGSHQGSRLPQHKAAGCRQLHISTADSSSYCRCQKKQRRNKPQQTFLPNMQEGEGGDTAAHPIRNLPPLQIHKGGCQQQKEKQDSLHLHLQAGLFPRLFRRFRLRSGLLGHRLLQRLLVG